MNTISAVRIALASSAMIGLLACTEEKDGAEVKGSSRTSGSLFAVMYEVFNEEDSDSYLSVFDSLDLEKIDTSNAREFAGGRAYLRAYNDWVFVGEPGTPTIRRFEVSKSGGLVEKAS